MLNLDHVPLTTVIPRHTFTSIPYTCYCCGQAGPLSQPCRCPSPRAVPRELPSPPRVLLAATVLASLGAALIGCVGYGLCHWLGQW